jgi:hypothetical protein
VSELTICDTCGIEASERELDDCVVRPGEHHCVECLMRGKCHGCRDTAREEVGV